MAPRATCNRPFLLRVQFRETDHKASDRDIICREGISSIENRCTPVEIPSREHGRKRSLAVKVQGVGCVQLIAALDAFRNRKKEGA